MSSINRGDLTCDLEKFYREGSEYRPSAFQPEHFSDDYDRTNGRNEKQVLASPRSAGHFSRGGGIFMRERD